MNVEEKSAEALLQKPYEVKVGDKTYNVAKPTLATLMEVSRFVSMLPKSIETEQDNIIPCILSCASEYGRVLAKIAAILIIGIGKGDKCPQIEKNKKITWFWKKRKSKVDILADEIINSASCEEISSIISGALSYQKIGFFLSTIISLSGANVSSPTKTEATVRGE